MKKLFKAILVTVDNEGNPLTDQIEAIVAEVLDQAGGYSCYPQTGVWRGDDGTIYRDPSLVVETVVEDHVAKELVALAPHWCELLRQEALLVTVSDTVPTFAEAVKPAELEDEYDEEVA